MSALKYHQKQECGKGKCFKCGYCDHTSKRRTDMKKHFLNRHSIDSSLEFRYIKLADVTELN